ncbi:MAG: PorV/PorQ family protein [Melioribacteraceae bacterium]|nr:PorV/PorQ family protein [Melioribacteraceae bacterium]
MKGKYIVLLLVVIPSMLMAQFVSDVSKRGTTAAPFLTISQGARATGMGSAFVAVADDPSAIFWNAAGIARLEQNGVTFDHTKWFADIGYNFAAITYNLGSFGTLGASFISSTVDEMDVTTIEEPEGTGETFGVQDVAVSLAWGFNITDNFSIGFNPKVVYQSIWKMSGMAFAIDLGVLYNTPFEGITLGASITNFGSKLQLDGTSSVVLYDDDITTSGNNGRIPARLQVDAWDLPLGFKVGLSYKPFTEGLHKLIIAVDAAHPNDNYEYVNVGGEYTFNNLFTVRGGYKSLFLEESEESFTIGAGIVQRIMGNINIRFDYAYVDFGTLDNIQKFSIGINF